MICYCCKKNRIKDLKALSSSVGNDLSPYEALKKQKRQNNCNVIMYVTKSKLFMFAQNIYNYLLQYHFEIKYCRRIFRNRHFKVEF